MADEEKLNQMVEQANQSQQSEQQQEAAPDYKKMYEETQTKYKDVDLERWERAKDFDFDKAEEAMTAAEKRAAREQEESEENEEGSEGEQQEGESKSQYEKRIAKLEKAVSDQSRQSKEQMRANWMERYGQNIESSISSELKGAFKDLEELSPQEKKYVKGFVDQAYEQDAGSKTPKLSLQTVGKIVSQAVKEVKENRAWITGRKVKAPSHPSMPNAQDAAAPKKLMSQSEKLEAMVSEYKGAQ